MGKKALRKQKVSNASISLDSRNVALTKQSKSCDEEHIHQPNIHPAGNSLDVPPTTMDTSRASQSAVDSAKFEQTADPTNVISMPTPPSSPRPEPAGPENITIPAAEDPTNKTASPFASKFVEPTPPTISSNEVVLEGTSDAMYDYQFGGAPLVIACISCSNVCLITNRLFYNNTKLGLHPNSQDRFFPIVCDECQEENAHTWLRIANAPEAPHRAQQYPSTISTRFLADWSVYDYFKGRFGVTFDESDEPNKRVTRARDWWREGSLTDNTAYERITYFRLRRTLAQQGDGMALSVEEKWEVDDDYKKIMFFGAPATGKPV